MMNKREGLRRGLLPVALALAVHFGAYYLPRLLISPDRVFYWDNPVDGAMPFVPAFVIFYVGAYLQWGLYYLRLVGEKGSLRYDFLGGEVLAKGVCALLFAALPVSIRRPELTGQELFSRALGIIYAADSPLCLFPSIHCLQSWLCLRYNRRRAPGKRGYILLSDLFSLGVIASTVLVKQHLLADAAAGVLLGEACLRLSPRLGLSERLRRLAAPRR